MIRIKDIENWEDYSIDINGNVFSKRRNKYMKPVKNKSGYSVIQLHKNMKFKTFTIHRLIAKAFIPNPNNYPCINHIDGNKLNNDISNLEWCTHKHNSQEAVRIGLFDNVKKIQRENAIKNNLSKYHILANEVTKKKVSQYDKNGNFIKSYNSMSDASRDNNIQITNISYCANSKRKSAGGYIWKLERNDDL